MDETSTQKPQKLDHVRVSEATRKDARETAEIKWEQLDKERDRLTKEKMEIETELSLLDANKNNEIAKAYRSRNPAEKTSQVSSRFKKVRINLIRRKSEVESRLAEVKGQMGEKSKSRRGFQDVDALLRIESLLRIIVEKLCNDTKQ